MPSIVDQIFDQAARNEMARSGVTYAVALARVNASVRNSAPLPAPQPTSGITPPLPPVGTVTNVRDARAHLSATMPGWQALNNEQRQMAAVKLRDLCRAPAQRAQLSRRVGATVLLGLWPGSSRMARARAYLSAAQPGFSNLTPEAQFERVKQLAADPGAIDLQGAA